MITVELLSLLIENILQTGVTGNFIIISVLYFGGTLVSDHMLTVGALTSFLFYAAYLGLAMSGISNFYTELNKGRIVNLTVL